MGLADGFHAMPEFTLGVEIFDDGFDNPVAVFELMEVIFEIARRDQRWFFVREKTGRPLLDRVFDALERGRVAIRLIGYNDVQKKNGYARVGKMRGNARSHGARAKHADTTNGSHD